MTRKAQGRTEEQTQRVTADLTLKIVQVRRRWSCLLDAL